MTPALLDRLPPDWRALLSPIANDAEWQKLLWKLDTQEQHARDLLGDQIAPAPENVFKALWSTPVNDVNVVLLGQDPYHSPGLAQGLAFSIPETIAPGSRLFPSSLRNISKALVIDGYPALKHGNLEHWANQGVLLLNATLTVEIGSANAHVHWGWQQFTNQLISRLSEHKNNLVWMLWGGYAQKKLELISNPQEHLILRASHPSGLGVYKTNQPFLHPGDLMSCGHFKKANEWLTTHKKPTIAW